MIRATILPWCNLRLFEISEDSEKKSDEIEWNRMEKKSGACAAKWNLIFNDTANLQQNDVSVGT